MIRRRLNLGSVTVDLTANTEATLPNLYFSQRAFSPAMSAGSDHRRGIWALEYAETPVVVEDGGILKNHGNVRPAEYSKPSVCAPQAK